MPMTHSEAAKRSAASRKAMEDRINAYCASYRPQVIRTYDEHGNEVKVIEAAYAQGYQSDQRIKSTSRQGNYL